MEIKRASTDPVKVTSSKDASITMTQTLKSGAKRKLNVRDDDDEPRGVDRPEKDEFQFSRNITESKKNENTISKSIATSSGKPANDKSSQVLCPGAEVSKEKAAEGPVKITSTSRKALGTSNLMNILCNESHLTISQRA